MAKKKLKRRYKSNIFADGGLQNWLNNSGDWLSGIPSGGQTGPLGLTQGGLSLASGLAGAASGVLGGFLNPKMNQTTTGNVMQTVGGLASAIPGVGGLIGAGVNLAGGLINTMFGSNINEDFVNQTLNTTRTQAGYASGASTNDQLMADWGSYRDVANVSKSLVGSDGWFSNKAKKKARELNAKIKEANKRALYSLANTATNIDTLNDMALLSNYAAYGGPLDFVGGAIDYDFINKDLNNKELKALGDIRLTSLPNSFQALDSMNTFADGGGIHIKKKNRGKFTEYCGGKVTEECIRRGKNSSNPVTRKRATFAANARKWHAFGGWLNTLGGDFTNGVNIINEGGTHEENPNNGIQVGVDSLGVPNLVEEGEVIYKDYVFSNRIKLPKKFKEKYKLNGETFADAAKKIQEESSERTNDPISIRGLDAELGRLAYEQEDIRTKRENRQKSKLFSQGGYLFAIGGPKGVNPWLDEESVDSEINPFVASLGPVQSRASLLRYAPIIGHGIGAIADIFSKPDYSAADMVNEVDITAPLVGVSPISNYLSYNPLDRDFYINKLNANAGASRRAILNNAGGNRAAAMAGILASDYNYGNQLGNLARQAEEYNQALRERTKGFNRQTNMFNTETGLRAASVNASAKERANQLRLNRASTVAAMRQAAKDSNNAKRSNNLNVLLEELGSLGNEFTQREWLDNLAGAGVLKVDTNGNFTGLKKAKGGKMKTKKKKGLTYG